MKTKRIKNVIITLVASLFVTIYFFNYSFDTQASKINDPNMKCVSAYGGVTMAVDTNGNLWGWDRTTKPTIIKNNVKAVSHAGDVVAYITENDELYMFGNNDNGQLGDGTKTDRTINNPYKVMENVSCVDVDDNYATAVTHDGKYYVWGWTFYGSLYGDKEIKSSLIPVQIEMPSKVKMVSTSECSTAVLLENGDLYMYGNNFRANLGNGTTNDIETPQLIMNGIEMVDVSDTNTVALTNEGDVYVWGHNLCGQTGNGSSSTYQSTPYKVKNIDKAKSISVGGACIAIITENDELYTWGNSFCGTGGNGIIYGNTYETNGIISWEEQYNQKTPVKIKDDIKEIILCLHNGFGIDKDGKMWVWGDAPGLGNADDKNNAYPSLINITGNPTFLDVKNEEVEYSPNLEGYYSIKNDENSLLKTSYSVDLNTTKDKLISDILPSKAYAKVRTNPNTVEWHQVEITWNLNNYNGNVVGNYQITGTVELINQTNYVSFDSKILEPIKISVTIKDIKEYNIEKATQYAVNNCLNPGLSCYSNETKQCAEFVSHCLQAGGIDYECIAADMKELESYGFSKYFIKMDENYIVPQGYTESIITPSELKVGDIIQYRNKSVKKQWRHVALVTKIEGSKVSISDANGQCYRLNSPYALFQNYVDKKFALDTWKNNEAAKIYNEDAGMQYYTPQHRMNYGLELYCYRYTGIKKTTSVELDLSNGWSGVEQECTEKDYSNIKVNMQDNKTVPASFLEYSKENDIDVIYDFGNYSWTVSADEIENAKDLNFEIREVNNKLPDVTASQLINPLSQLQLTYSGDFGLKALLNYNVGLLYSGRKVTLYYYDEENDSLQKIQTSFVDNQGYVSFDFTHASVYILDLEEEISGSQTITEKEKRDYFDDVLDMIDDVVAEGKNIIKINGIEKQITSLPVDVMRYAKNKKISIEFTYIYQNINYKVFIPENEMIVDEEIPWYGPLYLVQNYNKL